MYISGTVISVGTDIFKQSTLTIICWGQKLGIIRTQLLHLAMCLDTNAVVVNLVFLLFGLPAQMYVYLRKVFRYFYCTTSNI